MELLRRAVNGTLEDGGVVSGDVSLAIVADGRMREINARFLGRHETTDVIAFAYEKKEASSLCGEIVINASEARRIAGPLRHDASAELLLYAVHGALHLLGWEDSTAGKRNAVNRHAVVILAQYGVVLDDSTLMEEE